MSLANTIGANIVKARRKVRLTQARLAEAAAVTPQAVSAWENGKATPDIETLILIAGLTGSSLDELTGLAWNNFPAIKGSAGTVLMVDHDKAEAALRGEDVEGAPYFPRFPTPRPACAVLVNDASNAPLFAPGDAVVISSGVAPRPGDMVLIIHEGFVLLRKFTARGLVALHPDWAGVALPMDQVRVLGVVVEHTIPRRT